MIAPVAAVFIAPTASSLIQLVASSLINLEKDKKTDFSHYQDCL